MGEKVIKYIDLFAGMGGNRVALEQALKGLGLKGECVFTSEIKKHAIEVYKSNFNNDKVFGDITKIDEDYIPDFDIMLASTPCFIAGTLIQTTRGLLPIEEVEIGDEVLTHKNRYRTVKVLMSKNVNNITKVRAMSLPIIYTTEEHPFYVKTVSYHYDSVYENGKRVHQYRKRTLTDAYWKKASELNKGDYLGIAINQNSINKYNLTDEECWIIGRYIADGYIRDGMVKCRGRKDYKTNQVILTVGKSKVDEVKEKIKDYHVCCSEDVSVFRCIISSKRLVELCKKCGKGAENKQLPQFVLDLPLEKLQIVLDGYLAGDGNSYPNGQYQATSVSKQLIYGLQEVVAKVYKSVGVIGYCKRPETYIIDGRTVNQRDTYTIKFFKKLQKYYFYEDNILWIPVKSVEVEVREETVYNLEVEEDNSYTANNVIVHNCQAFSIAGARKGFEDARGTLFFDVARILKAKQPKYFFLENVEGLVQHGMTREDRKQGKEIGPTLEIMLNILEELGYKVTWKVLQASDFGVAQIRRRIYIVGTRENKVNLDNFEKKEVNFGEIQERGLPTIDSKFTRAVSEYLKENNLTWEHLYDKAIRDKRGSSNNIHSWTLGLRGKTSKKQQEFLELMVTERRKKEYAQAKGYPVKDGLGLTKEEIEDFSDISLKELEDLVSKKYLRKELLDSKYEIYDINGGRLSYEFTKILDPNKPSLTIVATDVKKTGVVDGDGIRQLTLREGLRLNAFPEDYKLDIDYNKGMDLLGNTVVVEAVKQVLLRVLES